MTWSSVLRFMSKKSKLFYFLFYFFVVVCGIVALSPSLRRPIQEWFLPSQNRVILAVAKGYLLNNDFEQNVFKIKTEKGLSIEVYENSNTGIPKFLGKADLIGHQQGHFIYRGESTDLALEDIDKDGLLDILVPSFDENLNARLNVFTYDKATQALIRMPTQSGNSQSN